MSVMKQSTNQKRGNEVVLRLIDIENLCGGSSQVQTFHELVRETIEIYETGNTSLTVVAAGSYAIQCCPNLLWDWKGDRFLIGHGLDGADLRLLEVLEEPTLSRVTKVEIWSGDHCFASIARLLIRKGIKVHVFARLGTLSDSLRFAATCVTVLSELAIEDNNELALAS
jgi:hypothetical protein